jgi:hypothetical protein
VLASPPPVASGSDSAPLAVPSLVGVDGAVAAPPDEVKLKLSLPTARIRADGPAARLSRRVILTVDDEAPILQLLGLALAHAGFDAVSRSQSGRRLVRQRHFTATARKALRIRNKYNTQVLA